MKRFILSLLPISLLIPTFLVSKPVMGASAEQISLDVDYTANKWVDNSPSSNLWTVDTENEMFEFNKENIDENNFTANTYITTQGETRESSIRLEATFDATRTASEIAEGPDGLETHIGLVPWYMDANNWLLVYAKFDKSKAGYIFSAEVYAKLDGSTHVEYFTVDQENAWISKSAPNNSEWHTAWPDGITTGMEPASLEDTKLDPSSEFTIAVRRSRKEFAGKTVDSIFVTINGYELNFGRDNFNFSGFAQKEAENPSFQPGFGFYAKTTGQMYVYNLDVQISNDEILPIPEIKLLDNNYQTSGIIGSKVTLAKVAAFAYDRTVLEHKYEILDPNDKITYLDGENYFVPTLEGIYKVRIYATDNEGLTGEFKYQVKVKNPDKYIDPDKYDDYLTYTPVDTAIIAAQVILIGTPIAIGLFVVYKIIMTFVRRHKKDE